MACTLIIQISRTAMSPDTAWSKIAMDPACVSLARLVWTMRFGIAYFRFAAGIRQLTQPAPESSQSTTAISTTMTTITH
jgi:hypothetical protein